ncbi:MAG: DUF4863 family protein [Planctomycetes bacterium]|nr:DUF4863 family protein [Planctomycetota bacterium]
MTEMTKEQFVELLRPLAVALRGFDCDQRDAAAAAERLLPFRGAAVTAVRKAAEAAIASAWLLPKENAGIRFGRVAKDLEGFSVDAVLMDQPGPKHRHPNGEIDFCFAQAGTPKFDGRAEGYVIYGKDTTHVPTVQGGTMLILYFLPGGAIEFLTS